MKQYVIVKFRDPVPPSYLPETAKAELLWQLAQPRPGKYFAVTLQPDHEISGEFIRFGQAGDELVGWQKMADIEVVQVVAEEVNGELKAPATIGAITMPVVSAA